MLARSSPERFVACHVLHRLLAPRHPPRALCSLTSLSNSPNGQSLKGWSSGSSPCRYFTAEIEVRILVSFSLPITSSLGKVPPPKRLGVAAPSSVPLVGDLEAEAWSPRIRGRSFLTREGDSRATRAA